MTALRRAGTMRRILYAAFVVSMLDAVTTYVLITTGRGYEANPFLQFINDVPETVFLVQIFGVLMLACSFRIFEKSAAVLPAALQARMYGFASAAFIVALCERAAVVVNNTMGIFWGITPLADFIFK
jgi:hypothetical protein